MRSATRVALRRLGLLETARRARALLGAGRVAGPMRFPPYAPEVERAARDSGDYVRYASLALAVHTLERTGVPGAFAEVGVYQGETSRFLMRCAPRRTLHLFDTFEGFPSQDLEPGRQGDARFRDTSEAAVRRMLGDPPNAVIHRGRFPETAAGLESERFAFVLLDLDLHAPTLAGLRFFHPRLEPGGYLFVHDVNSPESEAACRRAVEEFAREIPERPVEIPDTWGSVVLRKA